MNILQLANQLGVTPELVASTLVAVGIFGIGGSKQGRDDDPQPDQQLDVETIRRRLGNGLEDLSDADRRSLGFSSVNPDTTTLEQVQLAHDILKRFGRR